LATIEPPGKDSSANPCRESDAGEHCLSFNDNFKRYINSGQHISSAEDIFPVHADVLMFAPFPAACKEGCPNDKEANSMNPRIKIILPVLLPLVALPGAIGELSYAVAEKKVTTMIHDDMQREAGRINRELRDLLDRARRNVQRTGGLPAIRNFLAGDIRDRARQLALCDELKSVKDGYADFDRISLYDPEGKVVAASSAAVIGRRFADRDYVRVPRDSGKMFTSAPLLSRVTHTGVIVVSTPIIYNGKAVAILSGTLNLASFSVSELNAVHIGRQGHAFLLSAKGEVIAHPKQADLVFNDAFPESRIYKDLVRKGSGLESFANFRGENVFVFMEKDEESGIISVLQVDESDMLEGLDVIRHQGLLAVIAGVALGIAAMFLAVRPLCLPASAPSPS
jgi:C4-dicarboxylate-specific signal transduction histidine kinase